MGAELEALPEAWAALCAELSAEDPALFAQPRVAALGERLRRSAEAVSARLRGGADGAARRCVIHGDFKTANVFFGGSGCRDPKLGPCSPPLFAAARSSSFNASGGKYDMDEWCAGQLGTDSLAVAPGAVVRDQTFGLCSSSSILQPPSPGGSWYGGIFGLGMRALEQQSAQIVPPLTLLKQQGLIAKELFAVALGGHHPDDTSSSGGGEIHWGFTDPTMYHGNLTWHPMVKEGEDAPDGQAGEYVYYKVDVDAISLGGSTVQSQAQIMTDTGAVGIYPPSDHILNALHKLAGCKGLLESRQPP